MSLGHAKRTSVLFEFVSAVSSATIIIVITRKYGGGGIDVLGG